MYQVAICENDPVMLEQMRKLCEEILHDLEIKHEVSLFTSAEEVEKELDENKEMFHLLILDIKLGNKSGLTLAKELYRSSSEIGIIFVTNYREYAEEAYDAHPIHFLSKPISRTRLTEAIKIDLKRKSLPKTITLNYGKRMLVIPADEVHYFESRNHHVFICRNQETQEIRTSLSKVEALLPNQFQKCHASYLVNLAYVREVSKREIVLQGGKILPLSRTYADAFAVAYLRYFNTYLS